MDCFNDCGYSNVQHVKTIKLQQLCTCIQLYRTYLEKMAITVYSITTLKKKRFFIQCCYHANFCHCIRALKVYSLYTKPPKIVQKKQKEQAQYSALALSPY